MLSTNLNTKPIMVRKRKENKLIKCRLCPRRLCMKSLNKQRSCWCESSPHQQPWPPGLLSCQVNMFIFFSQKVTLQVAEIIKGADGNLLLDAPNNQWYSGLGFNAGVRLSVVFGGKLYFIVYRCSRRRWASSNPATWNPVETRSLLPSRTGRVSSSKDTRVRFKILSARGREWAQRRNIFYPRAWIQAGSNLW